MQARQVVGRIVSTSHPHRVLTIGKKRDKIYEDIGPKTSTLRRIVTLLYT